MNTVNPYFLHKLLDPLTGLGDDEEAVVEYQSLDSNNEAQVRAVIRDLIVPHAASLSEKCRERVGLAYQYYLTVDSSSFDRVFESVLPPFDPPEDPRDFFMWIWEECFPGKDFKLQGADNVVINADINEPLSVC